MTKHAQSALKEPAHSLEVEQQNATRREELRQLKEAEIRSQLAEFAKEFEQLKRLHK